MKLRFYLGISVLFFIWYGRAQEAQERPNILVIMFDDAGLDMSAYGSTYVNTPGFDAIAQDGILFNRAYTPNAKCAPSRAAVITGRNSWQLDAAANHVIYFPSKFKTYQEVLLENGYTTGHTGKGYGPALTVAANGNQRQVMGKAFNEKTLKPATNAIGPNDYSANFEDFLDKSPRNQPWSFWLGTIEPHRGYEYGSGARLAGKTTDMIQDFPPYWPDNETTRNDLLDYAYEIEDTDRHIQKVLKTLEERNLLENTLIVVTSDHGMPFPRVKGNQYENANHVPMAMLWKGRSKTKVVDDYVSFIDLAPTFLEAAGVDWQSSGMHPATGKSLMNIVTSEKSGQIESDRNYVLVGKERHDTGRPNDVGYPIRGIYKDSLLYLKNYEIDRWPSGNPETGYLNTDGSPTKTEILNLRREGTNKNFWRLNFGKRLSEELYDIKNDPFCIHNLADDISLSGLKAQLKSEMEVKLSQQNDLRMRGFGHLYEAHPFTRNNDFYSRFMAGEETSSGWVNDTDFEPNFVDGNGNTLKKVEINRDELKKAIAFEEVNGFVQVEAELFHYNSSNGTPRDWYVRPGSIKGMKNLEDHSKGASKHRYIESLPDTRITHDDKLIELENFFPKQGTGGIVSYKLNFNTAGRYYVWVRAYSSGSEDNGVHVGLDGEWPVSGARMQWCEGKNKWTWSDAKRMPEDHCGVRHGIFLDVETAGEHIISFSMREDGFEMDQWIMTTDKEYDPE